MKETKEMKAPPIIIQQPANMGNYNLGLPNIKTATAPPIFFRNDQLGRNILGSIETINEE